MAISIQRRAEDGSTRAEATEPQDRAARPRALGARGTAFVVATSAFLLLVAVFALSRSSLFAVRRVEVVGSAHRSASELLARAAIPGGANAVWLDTSAVARRLETDPWIERATVSRSLPWTIDIRVVERTPVAIVQDGAGRTLVATDGARLGAAPASSDLPVIMLPPAAPSTLGVPDERSAVAALRAMAPSVRDRVREVDVLVGGTLMLWLRDGSVIELGHAVELDLKARVLRRLLAWEQRTGTSLGQVSLVAPTAPAASIAG